MEVHLRPDWVADFSNTVQWLWPPASLHPSPLGRRSCRHGWQRFSPSDHAAADVFFFFISSTCRRHPPYVLSDCDPGTTRDKLF